MKKFKFKKFVSIFTVITIIASIFIYNPFTAKAASVTSFQDVLSTIADSAASNHTIYFVTPSGVQTTETITLTFDADFTGVSGIDSTDIDLAEGDSGTCSTAGYTEETLVASGATTSQWNASASGQVVTLESGGASATIASAVCVRIEIGLHATEGVTGNEQITNGVAANAHSVVVGGTFGDTGTAAIDIIADDSVSITATVDPSISFSISDVAVGFGTLSSSTATWATADATGTTSQPGATSGAHELAVGTNATGGYAITYNGATLTSGGDTISAATITGDADGNEGSEDFALAIADNGGDVTIPSAYDYASNNYSFVAGTTTTLASESGPSATETIDVQYIANISALTEAGSYSTAITYIATGTF